MAWRYCEYCNCSQNRITLEEIETIAFSPNAKVGCKGCHSEREDDTPYERFSLLLEEVLSLRMRLDALNSAHSTPDPLTR